MARGLFGTNSFLGNNNGYQTPPTSSADIREYGEEIAALRTRVERLDLICEALWTFLQREGHTDEELVEILSELDTNNKAKKQAALNGSDSEEDKPQLCPNCHVPLQATDSLVDRCIYCGHEIVSNPFK